MIRIIPIRAVPVIAVLAAIVAPATLFMCGHEKDQTSLYLVVERFKNKDSAPAYRRFQEKGRMSPEGLKYVSGWVDEKNEICYQLMETADPKLFDVWTAKWDDLIDFQLHPLRNLRESLAGIQVCALGTHQLGITLRLCNRLIRHRLTHCSKVLTWRAGSP